MVFYLKVANSFMDMNLILFMSGFKLYLLCVLFRPLDHELSDL